MYYFILYAYILDVYAHRRIVLPKNEFSDTTWSLKMTRKRNATISVSSFLWERINTAHHIDEWQQQQLSCYFLLMLFFTFERSLQALFNLAEQLY